MRLSVLAFPIVFTLLPIAAPSAAQSELEFSISALLEQPTIPIETKVEGWYELANEHIPFSDLVGDFFRVAEIGLTAHPNIRERYLESFGIKPGTQAESALIAAVLAATHATPDDAERERRNQHLGTLRDDEASFMSTRREYAFSDERRMGKVYGHLVRNLGGSNSRAVVMIRRYIDAKLRPGTGISSDKSFSNPDHFVWKCDKAFHQGMSASLQQTSSAE